MHLRSDVGLIVDLPKFLHFFGDRSLVIFFHKSFLYLIQLVWMSRIDFGLYDLRLELLGLITCGGCRARVSSTLQVFKTEWYLISLLVDKVFLELFLVYQLCCVFLCRTRKD